MSQTPRNRPHLYLRNNDQFRQSIDYTSPRSGNTPPLPDRNRIKHATKLEGAIGKAIAKARQQLESRTSEIAVGQPGFYLEFEVTKDQANEFEKLENKTKQIELVAVKQLPQQEDTVKATVFVPESATEFFEKKVQQYRDEETQKGNPKNAELITRLENVEIGTVQSLFTDDPTLFPENDEAIWWEVWLRHGKLEDFKFITQRLEITTKSEITFPERIVVLAMANIRAMELVIQNSDTVAELRIAKDTPSFFLEMKPLEQKKRVEDLYDRILPPKDDAVAVCLLDTGVNHRHPLIQKGLNSSDLYACESNWGNDDHHGHGTQMAGLILYYDLLEALATQKKITLFHRLESVKILPPVGQNENDPELYGAITGQAVSYPEIHNPTRPRIFCMAITSEQPSPNYGTPSSWSATIDQLSFGENNFKRLIIISAGNIREEIYPDDYPNRNDLATIENPAQAWNALIVGAYTEKVNISDPTFRSWQPLAPCGDLSPRSCTSVSWENQWPIRPDIVFEGGNYATDGTNPAQSIDDLSLLTTYHILNKRLFERMSDTSCATALTSHMAALILSAHPQYWPETIRALIVHSAEWTSAMKKYFNKAPKQKDKKNLIRRYGYGVPNLDRALNSSNSDLTLIIEDRLLPFKQGKNGIKTNKMNVYDLPWPKEKLEELGETNVELKVTLSYFIEPNPGVRGYKRKHRYVSYGLRFEVKRPLESDTAFQYRINQVIRDEEKNIISTNTEDNNWFLGSNLRNKGSLHCDIWTGTAADLADRGMVGVYPVSGWWKEQKQLERYNESVRYTLIVTIRVPEVECDIYTPVSNLISQSMPAKISTEINI
jgi:hypothetical protein